MFSSSLRLLQVPSLFHDSFQRGECVCRTLVPSCPRVNAADSNIGSSRHLSLGPRCHQEGQLSCFASSRQIPESRACLHGQSTRNGKGGQARNRAIWVFSRQRAGNFSVARVRQSRHFKSQSSWHEGADGPVSLLWCSSTVGVSGIVSTRRRAKPCCGLSTRTSYSLELSGLEAT